MTFAEWAGQVGFAEWGYSERVAERIWDAAVAAERARCVAVVKSAEIAEQTCRAVQVNPRRRRRGGDRPEVLTDDRRQRHA